MKILSVRDEYLKADGEGKARLLAKTYSLQRHQIWQHKQSGKWIVALSGVESIAAQEGVSVSYRVVRCEPDFVVIEATPSVGDVVGQSTFGEASSANTKMGYPVAMAEKRAYARAALKMVLAVVGGYGGDFYSDVEADEFKESSKAEHEPAHRPEKLPARDLVAVEFVDFLGPLVKATDGARLQLAVDDLNRDHKRKGWFRLADMWLAAKGEIMRSDSRDDIGAAYRAFQENLGDPRTAAEEQALTWLGEAGAERIVALKESGAAV